MHIEAKRLICGVKPTVLKTLLKKGQFDTPTAMKALGLREPEASRTLIKMAKEGWLDYHGQTSQIDFWGPGTKGQRLTATRLLKRIPRRKAEQIIADLLDEVRKINADANVSLRITEVLLFGSALPARESSSIGDVDVVVEIYRRLMPNEILKALRSGERSTAPAYVHRSYSGVLGWPHERLRRRLRAVSRYLSFHHRDDLAGGAQFQQIYAYDLKEEREIPVDPQLQRGLKRESPGLLEEIFEALPEPQPPPRRGRRAWPAMPKRSCLVQLSAEQARRAQHLWTSGATLLETAKGAWVHPEVVEAYLAGQGLRKLPLHVEVSPSLKRTLFSVVPESRDFDICVRRTSERNGLEILIDRPERSSDSAWPTGRLYQLINESQLRVMDPAVISVLEDLEQATQRWFSAMRSRLHGLTLCAVAECTADESSTSHATAGPLELREIADAVQAFMGVYHASDKERQWVDLTVGLSSPVTLQLTLDGVQAPAKWARVVQARAILERAEALVASCPWVLKEAKSRPWQLRVTGIYSISEGMRLLSPTRPAAPARCRDNSPAA